MSLATLTGPPTTVGHHHAGDGDVGNDGDGDTKTKLHFCMSCLENIILRMREKTHLRHLVFLHFAGCRDIDECRDGSHNCAPPNHICSNTAGNVTAFQYNHSFGFKKTHESE